MSTDKTEPMSDAEGLADIIDKATPSGVSDYRYRYALHAGRQAVSDGWVSPETLAAREAAARRDVLAEAIARIESLAGDYVNGGHTLSWQGARHCVETLVEENR